jgi:hypothetical protein
MDRKDYLVLVNKDNRIPDDWENRVELVELKNVFNRTVKVEKETLDKYYELRDSLLKD